LQSSDFFSRRGSWFCYNWRMKGQVQIYRNLHKTTKQGKAVYSVRNDKGIVEDHVTEISLLNPVFRVGKAGKARVRKEKRKNVHAYIQGIRMKGKGTIYNRDDSRNEWYKVTYNPYKNDDFVIVDHQDLAVKNAYILEITEDGVWAFKPTVNKVNLLEV